jgi:hypothetical protein
MKSDLGPENETTSSAINLAPGFPPALGAKGKP